MDNQRCTHTGKRGHSIKIVNCHQSLQFGGHLLRPHEFKQKRRANCDHSHNEHQREEVIKRRIARYVINAESHAATP
jgi:hypothetical protein